MKTLRQLVSVADVDAVLMKVEREVIDKLDELICDGRGDYQYKQLFTTTYVPSSQTAVKSFQFLPVRR